MAKYLTPKQYFLLDDSLPDATTMSPAIFARMIQRAESLIDTYVGFDARLGGFEAHSASYQSAFDDRTLRVKIPQHPVPVRAIDRYRIQVSNIGTSGAGFFANIQPQDCVITDWGGYIEIVPLQAVTYSMTPFMLGLGLQPPIVQVDYQQGYYLPAYGEILDNPEDDLLTYHAQRGYWATSYVVPSYLQPFKLPPTTPVVYINGTATTVGATPYTLDPIEGTVLFASQRAITDVISLDYTYTIPDPVRDATVAQVNYLLEQRGLNLMGMGGIEVARSRDQQIKRHIRASQGASAKDEAAISSEAMQLLEPYMTIPFG